MILGHFLIVNRHKIGYDKIWPLGTRHLEDSDLETLLPRLNPSATAPGLAYSATCLTEGRYVLIVGLRWPHLRDETGRSGLYFWHGVVCRPKEADHQVPGPLSALMLGIVRRYEVLIDAVGDIIQSVATKPMEEGWARELCQSAVGRLPTLDKVTSRIVLIARKEWANVPEAMNLRISFPFHDLLAVPCLVDLLASCGVGKHVGGGDLLLPAEPHYAAISRVEETAGFRTIDLSAKKLTWSVIDRTPRRSDPQDQPHSSTTKLPTQWKDRVSTIGENWLVILFWCCFVFVAPWLIAFMINLFTQWEDLVYFLNENWLSVLLFCYLLIASRWLMPRKHPAPATAAKNHDGLWAILSVNHPVFQEGKAKDLLLELTLLNEGEKILDPQIADSRIIINGKELADSDFFLGNGSHETRSSAMSPGKHLRFGYDLGKYCEKPGIYHVTWRGKKFGSPKVEFRILSDPERSSLQSHAPEWHEAK